jgi:hypothetical protein
MRAARLALIGDGDEQVFDAHVLVLQAFGLGVGRLQHLDDAGRCIDLHHVVGQPGRTRQVLGDAVAQLGDVDAQLLEDLVGEPWVLQEGEEHVLHVPLAVPLLPHELLAAASTSWACSVNLSCLIMADPSAAVRVPMPLVWPHSVNGYRTD